MSTEGDIDKTIWTKRLSNYASFFPLILYLPLGLVLGIIRFCIFLHVCLLWYILPQRFPLKRMIIRVMLTITGLPISIQGMPALDSKKKIFIANHVSNLDPFVLALLNPNILTLDASMSGITWSRGKLKTYDLPADRDHVDVIKTVKDKMKDSTEPLLFFPERLKTNGKNSLLKFSSLPFEMDCPIQPITIQTDRYLFDIHVSTYSSSVFQDIAWCFLTPMTLFRIKYLPVTEQKKDESKEEFATRVQINMAKSLGLQSSSLSRHDVIEHVKKNVVKRACTSKMEKPKIKEVSTSRSTVKRQQMSREISEDAELRTMLRLVKDVLPDTPTRSILADLKNTRDVDVTITNILEGKLEIQGASETPEKNLTSLSQGLSFKASTFENDAKFRQLSFAERKQAMLEAARLKYRMKYGL